MSGSWLLRLQVNERLEAAVDDIFGLVEKTLAEYEKEAVRSKREIGQLKRQLEQLAFLKPEVILTRAGTQPVFEAWPPSSQQYGTEESPVLEEVVIQECPRVKETAARWLGPDVEVDAANEAEAKRGINRLKRCAERQADLKAEVTSSTAGTQEVCPSPQPVTAEGTETRGAERIREEPEETPISPGLEADAFYVYKVREPEKYCEPLSSDNESTDNNNGRTEVERPSAERQRPRRGNKSCHVCGLTFTQDDFLIGHMASRHKGHKPFRCPHCKKEFNQRRCMVSHMWKHMGQQPFRCDFCEKTYHRKDSCLTHMEQFHKVKASTTEALNCSICNTVFKRRHLLMRHASVHNGGKSKGETQ